MPRPFSGGAPLRLLLIFRSLRDWGMKRTDYGCVVCELGKALDMNWAWGVEFVDVDPTMKIHETKKGRTVSPRSLRAHSLPSITLLRNAFRTTIRSWSISRLRNRSR